MDVCYIVIDLFGSFSYVGTDLKKAMENVENEKQYGEAILQIYEDGTKVRERYFQE